MKKLWKKLLLIKKNNKNINNKEIKKVLFMTMTFGLGDGIRNTGIIEALAENYQLDTLGNKNQEIINKFNEKISNIYVYRCKKNKKVRKSLLLNLRLIMKLRKNKYDLIIDGHSSSKSFNLLFLRLLNANKIYGLKSVNNKYGFNENEIRLYDKLFNNYLDILEYLKIKSKKDTIRLPKDIEKKYSEIIPKIIFNTEGSTRKIEESKLKEILELLDNIGQEIWMISTPNRRKEIEAILSVEKYKNIKILPPTNFYEAIEFIRRCELLISPNTALIHVASIYNKKIIGLYSNLKWHTELWKPTVDEYELIIPKKEALSTDDLGEINSRKIKEAFIRLLKLED